MPAEDDDVAGHGFGVIKGFWIIRATGPLLVDAMIDEDHAPRQRRVQGWLNPSETHTSARRACSHAG